MENTIQRPECLLYSTHVGVDIETYDPNLIEKGPGVYRKDGYILGVSLSNGEFSEYYNLGHKDITVEERDKNARYVKDVLRRPSIKIGTNINYDFDWLENFEKMPVYKEKIVDIQVAEALIDENQPRFNLDYLNKKYRGKGKYKNEIDAFCEQRKLKGDARKHLYLMPYNLVRKYAIEDSVAPFEIWKQQKVSLEQQELFELFEMEMELLNAMLFMRKTGVRVNLEQTKFVEKSLQEKLQLSIHQLHNITGKKLEINHNSGSEIGFLLDKLGISYPLTPSTKKPSITKPWLELNEDKHPVLSIIQQCRKYDKLIGTFCKGTIENAHVNGRIHATFNTVKSGTNGTVTGRMSCNNPNLLFIPKNDEETKSLIRSLFIPEEDHDWVKLDYSQIEYMLFLNIAFGKGADEMREEVRSSKEKVDFHQWCADMAGIKRQDAKRINFGILYGMGVSSLANKLKITYDEAKVFLEKYKKRLPFMQRTSDLAMSRVKERGYVYTILKRRRRITEKKFAYKALNAVVQGSSADLMKKSIVDAYKAGIFDVLKPHITVYDELDVSSPKTKEGIEAVTELKNIMETTVPLSIPINVDAEIGPNWGDLCDFSYKGGVL